MTQRTPPIEWPRKLREMQNHHMDSTRWNDFAFRDDDVVIATWAKSGTTWLQQIIGQLVFDGATGIPVFEISPWVDHRVMPKNELFEMLEAQTHRRFVKTHLPVESLVFSRRAKYVYIGRDGRDTLWSWYNHHVNFMPIAYELMNETPGRVGPPLMAPRSDVRRYFHEWLDRDGYPLWPYWSHIQSWWNIRQLPNVLLLHFANLKRDLPGEIRRIARFLEIDPHPETFIKIVEHSSFKYMKRHAATLSPMLDEVFEGGARAFVHRGTNGRWRDVLTPSDIYKYEVRAGDSLSPECAHWLATGEELDTSPSAA